ncbi:MAG: diaminopimelate dehydrogenase [Clostridia bacterium]|nr:diaminopimelate dehydrogenase [Clostridia bacterium]
MKVAIVGYGNLGKGTEKAVASAPDMELVGVFTRRGPDSVKTATGVPVYWLKDIYNMRDKIDVLVLCGGSATDLPEQTPNLAGYFNVVDSFDTHAKIPQHFDNVDKASKEGNKVSVISVGWDPGLFSLNRILGEAVLPGGSTYTFWGKGVSQGHSDAIRRIDGVKDARQYTVPVEEAVQRVRNGENPTLSVREKHTRECYVVAEENADLAYIEKTIKEMPDYFKDYDTTVHFITEEELRKEHSGIPHGGTVIRSGDTGGNKHLIEFSLNLDSNPEFTASVLVAYARAAYRMYQKGDYGCKTIFDIPPAFLHPQAPEELRKNLL